MLDPAHLGWRFNHRWLNEQSENIRKVLKKSQNQGQCAQKILNVATTATAAGGTGSRKKVA
jgi:uncharacterized protein YcaQ